MGRRCGGRRLLAPCWQQKEWLLPSLAASSPGSAHAPWRLPPPTSAPQARAAAGRRHRRLPHRCPVPGQPGPGNSAGRPCGAATHGALAATPALARCPGDFPKRLRGAVATARPCKPAPCATHAAGACPCTLHHAQRTPCLPCMQVALPVQPPMPPPAPEAAPTLQASPLVPAPAPAPEASLPVPAPEASPPAPAPLPQPGPPSPAVQLVATEDLAASLQRPGAAPLPESVVPPVGAPAPPAAVLPLPPPAPAAPEVVDTRPPRPPGVGPSITPAPPVFSPAAGLPTLPPQPAAPGPLKAEQLVGAPGPGACNTIGEILGQIPEAANWTQLLTVSERAAGLVHSTKGAQRARAASTAVCLPPRVAAARGPEPAAARHDRPGHAARPRHLWCAVRCTCPAAHALALCICCPCWLTHQPCCSCAALTAQIDARPLRNESTLSELLLNAPELENPLVGYHGESTSTTLVAAAEAVFCCWFAAPCASAACRCPAHPTHLQASPPPPLLPPAPSLQCCPGCGPRRRCSRARPSTRQTPSTK